ncbi:hypothetical protein QAD02_011745 [Eretmocerus hayati]|uniref:Uncharacterized protein n=1 Tax=Eretmocerus hayati TaxID=131215 RepID=A0ACC2NY03_9HYME|nr:hypothetical protein QAD02_011745 [Eretmocerus hayati]
MVKVEEGGDAGVNKKPKPPIGRFALGVSILVHLLLLLPVIYILEIAFENLNLFAWHPICMTLGAGLLIMEGVYSISGEAVLNKRLSRLSRVRLHWISNTLGLALLITGFIIIVINKNINEWPHFTTTHSIFGLVTFILVCLVALFGILANNAQWLYPRIRPALPKVIHAFFGMATMILLLVTLVLGTFSGWWYHVEASITGRALVLAAYVIAALIILVKPIIGAIARTRMLKEKLTHLLSPKGERKDALLVERQLI